MLRQTYPRIEFLILDNNSTDGTAEKIDQFLPLLKKKLPVTSYQLQENKGFAAGHNFGISKSKGKFIILLNQDAVLDERFVERIIKPFENGEVAAVQGKTLRPSGDVIDSAGLIILKNRRIISRGQGEKDGGQYDGQKEIFGVDGAVPALRRAALEDVKGDGEYFDENFFMYKEDVDLAWRLRLAGWKAMYEPTAIAYHFRGAGESAARNYFAIVRERLKINPLAKYYSFKNQRLMQIKNETPRMFMRDAPRMLFKEAGSWLYVLLFERYTVKAIIQLFKEIPSALRKRKIVMAKRRISEKEMEKWFE